MIEAGAVGVILLAAGRSSRFGLQDKLAALLDGQPLASHAATTLSHIPFRHRILVCTSLLPVDWQTLGFEMMQLDRPLPFSGSLAAGIDRLQSTDCSACLVALADMPFVPTQHFETLLSRYSAPAIATGGGGKAMVPAIFGRSLWAQLKTLSGDHGARDLIADCPRVEARVEWLVDIDTPDQLEHAQQANNA